MTETYESDPGHPWAQRWRIPRVHTPYPRWQFEVALCIPYLDNEPDPLWQSIEPSEEEARIVGWYIAYRRAWYAEHWQQRMLERPFDIDSSTNTVILMCTESGWTYRRATHQHGPWPFFNDERRKDYPPTAAGLLALLDHIGEYSTWPKWKAEHPLAEFGGAQLATAPQIPCSTDSRTRGTTS